MKEWKEVILGDYIDTNVSSVSKAYPFDEIIYLDTGSITCNKIEQLQKLKLSEAPSRAKRIVKSGDIIFSTVRPNQLHYGYILNPVENLVVSTGFVTISVNKEFVFSKYLYYNLTQRNTIEYLHSIAEASTSTYPSLKPSDIEALEIQLPPLPEQKAIASVLSSLDDKIDLLHQQNETLEALAETLFRQWFVEEAKEDWEDCTIGDLADHSKISVHPKKNPDILYHHYSIPSFDANKKPVIELGAEIQSNKYTVERYSILFSKLNPHKDKRVWLILDNVEENAICSTELQVVKPKDISYLYFVYGWLTNSIYYNEIASGVGGTSGSHQRIDPKAIFTAPCVKVEEQIILDFNAQVEPLFKKQFENQQQIQTLTKLRDTLLPKLMSGEVRVKH